jgi:PIN domain
LEAATVDMVDGPMNGATLPGAKPRVLLDANILIANFRSGRAFKLLLDGARTGQLELIVPEIALREAANKFEERCTEERRALEKAMGRLSRLGVQTSASAAVDPQAERLRYERNLRRSLRSSGGRTPGIAKVPHGALVDRALQRRKPFKDNGAGYRDALLWETVLKEAGSAALYFFTLDGSDFAVDGKLAADLARDLERTGCDAESVELRTDLAVFVAESVNVEVIALDDVRRVLPRTQPDLDPFVRRVLFDVNLDRRALRRALARDHTDLAPEDMVSERLDVGDAQVLEVFRVSDAKVEKADVLSTGDVLAELYVEVEVGLDIEVDLIGHDARSGRPRFASCIEPVRARLRVDIDATYTGDDLALLDLGLYDATLV